MPQQSAPINKTAVCTYKSQRWSDSLLFYEASPETERGGQTAVQHITQIPSA